MEETKMSALLADCIAERDRVADELRELIKRPCFKGHDLEVQVEPYYQEQNGAEDVQAWVNVCVYDNMGADEEVLKNELLLIAYTVSESTPFFADVEYSEIYDTFPFHVWAIILGTDLS